VSAGGRACCDLRVGHLGRHAPTIVHIVPVRLRPGPHRSRIGLRSRCSTCTAGRRTPVSRRSRRRCLLRRDRRDRTSLRGRFGGRELRCGQLNAVVDHLIAPGLSHDPETGARDGARRPRVLRSRQPRWRLRRRHTATRVGPRGTLASARHLEPPISAIRPPHPPSDLGKRRFEAYPASP
jgi:hypothetical protein